jgi:hypothetical protein
LYPDYNRSEQGAEGAAFMAMAAALVDLLPLELQVWVTKRAATEGTTPDQMVLTLLTGAAALIDYADRDRGLPPVPAYTARVTGSSLDREISRRAEDAAERIVTQGKPWSIREAVRRAVVSLGEADADQVRTEVNRLMGFTHAGSTESLRTILSQLAIGGAIQRIRYGVYGPVTRRD